MALDELHVDTPNGIIQCFSSNTKIISKEQQWKNSVRKAYLLFSFPFSTVFISITETSGYSTGTPFYIYCIIEIDFNVKLC